MTEPRDEARKTQLRGTGFPAPLSATRRSATALGHYSLASTASAVAVFNSPFRMAVLWPSSEGSLSLASTIGSMMNEKNSPQPSAFGTEKALSTKEFSLSVSRKCPNSFLLLSLPTLPLIDLFGASGEVLPVVRCSSIGFDSEPR